MKTMSITMERQDGKETKGCFRYAAVGGDAGVSTLYVQKVAVGPTMPKRITLTVTELTDQ
jgi:hypothetical protein